MPRRSFLEIDKVNGTEFPPNSVNYETRTYSLKSIFEKAEIELDIREDESNITDLGGPDSRYSQSELLSLMRTHKNPQYHETDDKWSTYLVIVTKFVEDYVLGIMFDSKNRLGSAVFYQEDTIRDDPRAFLRTAAHELGHQFNLHHQDGSTYKEGKVTKNTIMNQTRLVTPWPEALSYEFSDHSKRHLSQHPEDNVKPGGSRFLDCTDEHSGWHGGIT